MHLVPGEMNPEGHGVHIVNSRLGSVPGRHGKQVPLLPAVPGLHGTQLQELMDGSVPPGHCWHDVPVKTSFDAQSWGGSSAAGSSGEMWPR